MSDSPINFLGMLGAAGAIMGSRKSKKSRRKIKSRVSKLENQMQAIQRKENAGPTQVEQPIEIQPETLTGTVPQAFDGGPVDGGPVPKAKGYRLGDRLLALADIADHQLARLPRTI